MLILNYTADDEDLKFALFVHDRNATFVKEDKLSLSFNGTVFNDLDGIIEQFFILYGTEYNTKKLNEFKRARKTPMLSKPVFNVISVISYINLVKDMLVSGSLKNKEIIDEFTKQLHEREVRFDPEFYTIDIRAGRIETIDHAEGMDLLFCETVKADKEYFICSGLRATYKKEDLVNNTYLFVLNIKKVKFKKYESEGMICCTSKKEGEKKTEEALRVDANPGTKIELEGYLTMFEECTLAKVDIKKSTLQRIFGEFKITNHHLTFKGNKVKIAGKYVTTVIENGPVS